MCTWRANNSPLNDGTAGLSQASDNKAPEWKLNGKGARKDIWAHNSNWALFLCYIIVVSILPFLESSNSNQSHGAIEKALQKRTTKWRSLQSLECFQGSDFVIQTCVVCIWKLRGLIYIFVLRAALCAAYLPSNWIISHLSTISQIVFLFLHVLTTENYVFYFFLMLGQVYQTIISCYVKWMRVFFKIKSISNKDNDD